MPDIASLGLEINTKQVVEGAKALDALATAATSVEPKVDAVTKATDGLSQSSAKVWRFGTDAAKSVEALGEVTQRTGQRYQVSNGQMADTIKIMRQQADESKAAAAANVALGTSSNQASIGAQIFIEKLKEQVAVLGMSRSQLLAYQAAQLGVAKEAEASIAKLKAYEDAIKAAADAKAAAAKQSNVLADSLKMLAQAYAALKIAEYIKESALLAARYETLGVVVEVVGRNAGYTKTQMDTATDAIARQGITMVESRESATKLVQAHVDLKNATVLARIAQDAAVIGHLNSSDAFDRLVNGISRGNVLILRNIGINVNLQTAYRQMADELGKTTKELTENERVQARLNAVVERGADIAGTYEAAMGTAGKQITSMQRYVQDLKTVVGEAFLEVLTVSVMALTGHLKDANKEVSELSKNQQLHEWGRDLAGIFNVIAEAVDNASIGFRKLSAREEHIDNIKTINTKYKELANEAAKNSSFWSIGFSDAGARAASAKASELAAEEARYEEHQAKLSSQFDRFSRAAAERDATVTAKRKAELEARLKVDEDYAKKAAELLALNANKPVAVQQAAQVALANSIYVGTPTYRDTEALEPKPKVDKVESTELADRLARIQDLVNAEKEMYETMSKMDDMFHSAGKMGDEQYYQNKRNYAEAAAKDQVEGYTKQIAELRAYHNGTEAEAAKHAKQINDIEAKRAAAGVKAEDEMNLLGAKEILRKEAIVTASDEATNKYLSGLEQEAKKLEESNAAHETSKGAVERETIARLDLAIAYQKQFMADRAASGATAEEIAQAPAVLKYLEDVRAARARIAAGLDQQQANQFNDKSAEQAIKDWQRAGQSISDSLTDAFGNGGKALGGMFQAYAKGMSAQLRAHKDLAAAKKLSEDNPDKIGAIQRAQLEGARAQVGSYADMATAAQGFFNEGSRGYKAMHAASMVLHAAEVSLSLIKGVNAVLTQGEGDPYSAFARMAAMAAIVAGLGVAIGGAGGGGVDVAKQRQETQGTGSVFGDSTAKSDSIARSLELVSSNSNIELGYTQGMLAALRNIESSLDGLGSVLVRNSGLTSSTIADKASSAQDLFMSMQPFWSIGAKSVGKLVGSIFGGAKTVDDTGFKIDPTTLGGALDGALKSFQYTDITKKGGWFSSDKKSTEWNPLGAAADSQFESVISGIAASVETATALLGLGSEAFTDRLNGFVIDIGKISLKGMNAEDIQKTLESVFSKLGDDLASYAVGGLDAFAKIGEGPLETLTRIASNYANLDSILASSGTSFGQVGMASITARERLIEFAGGIDELASKQSSFNDNFLTEAERLAPVQQYVTEQLTAMGYAGIDTRDKFKEVVLGLANSGALATAAGADTYTALLGLADAFAKTHAATEDLTKSEQEIADERKDLAQQLGELTKSEAALLAIQRAGIADVNKALFDQVQAAKAVVSAKDALATAYDKEAAAAKTAIEKSKAWVSTLNGLNANLALSNQSTLTPEQKYAEARAQFEKTLAAAKAGDTTAQSGLSAAEQAFLTASQVVNASDAKYAADYARVIAANEEAAKWAQTQVDLQQASYDALEKQVKGLITINDSVLTVAQAIAKLQAAMGTATGLGVQFDGSHASGLTNVPFDGYAAELHQGEVVVDAQAAAAMRRYFGGAPSQGGGNHEALVAEIKSLREEVKGLRAEQATQTGALVRATTESNARAAGTVVAGVEKSARVSAWASTVKGEYA